MRGLVVLALAFAACGDRTAPVVRGSGSADAGSAAPVAARSERPRMVTSPHASAIALVVLCETGDPAALTADELGSLRLWPTLDGTREPVVVKAVEPVALALARTSAGFLAAVLDAAGGVELIRLDHDGSTRGRQLVPAEPAYVEIDAVGDAILARRRDQVIVRLGGPARDDALTVPAGEQVLGIAVRGTRALAAIARHEADGGRPDEVSVLRWIEVADGVRWGAQIALPPDIPRLAAAPLAVSPSGRHVAGIDARTGTVLVLELNPPRVAITGPTTQLIAGFARGGTNVLGFLDDNRVVTPQGAVLALVAIPPPADPWSEVRGDTVRADFGAVVGDDVVVGGVGMQLVLARPTSQRFLGYRDLGIGFLRVTGEHVTLGFGNRVLWLDDRLRMQHSSDMVVEPSTVIPIDDHRFIRTQHEFGRSHETRTELRIFDGRTDRELGTYHAAAGIAYDPSTRVIAIPGYNRTTTRLQLDADGTGITKIASLRTRSGTAINVLDPAVADGIVAVAIAHEGDLALIETFVDGTAHAGELAPASLARTHHAPFGVDRSGRVFALSALGRGHRTVAIYHHGKRQTAFAVDDSAETGAIDSAGKQIVLWSSTHVFAIDAMGHERWRVPLWRVNAVAFSPDGRTLFVNTQGGLVALAADNGRHVAAGCGWSFGVSPIEPPLAQFHAPVVCEEAVP